jgi:peroxiredoxin
VKLTTEGSFKFKKQSAYAQLFKLKADTTQFDVIAQNGDEVELTTDLADKAHAYTVSGSDESVAMQTFDELAKANTDQNNKLSAEFDQKSQAGANSDSLLKVYRPVFEKNQAAYTAAVFKFAGDRKGSLATFYAMTSLDALTFEQQLIAYADGLSGDITHNPDVALFIKVMEKAKPLSIGHQAPDFITKGIDGKPVKLSDFKGKYVMLDFWASWCVPCREENPNVVKQYAAFHAKGFNILSISLDKDKAPWQKAIHDDHLAWIQASDLNSFQGPVELLYHIEGIPFNFIIDPKGAIVAKNLRGAELADFLKSTFKN